MSGSNEKVFRSLVRLQKRFSKLYRETGLVGVSIEGVHIGTEDMVVLSEFAEVVVYERGSSDVYPCGALATFEDVTFVCVGTEQEFIKAGIFVAAVRSQA